MEKFYIDYKSLYILVYIYIDMLPWPNKVINNKNQNNRIKKPKALSFPKFLKLSLFSILLRAQNGQSIC